MFKDGSETLLSTTMNSADTLDATIHTVAMSLKKVAEQIAMHMSILSSAKLKHTTMPVYTPQCSPSRPKMSSMAFIFGMPDTVPARKMEQKASKLPSNIS